MSAVRNCPTVPLSKKPLALVLIQVRFSPISNMVDFIPEIQNAFRKTGFPEQSKQEITAFEVSPHGVKTSAGVPQWRFETPAHDSVILIDQEQVTFQTVEYTSFEDFIKKFLSVVEIVARITEHDKYGVINRLGLRYIDQIKKQNEDDSIESYLRQPLRGMECDQYSDNRKQYTISTIGKTVLPCERNGILAIRIIRGEPGLDLPPDLIAAAPAARRRADPSEDIAIIDMDHYWEGSIGPGFDILMVEELFFRLHDSIINGFHSSVVSEEGIKKWT